jgi:hypothetical protein
VKPITIAQAMSQPSDLEFGAGVPAAHRSHYGSALFGCSCVGHRGSIVRYCTCKGKRRILANPAISNRGPFL